MELSELHRRLIDERNYIRRHLASLIPAPLRGRLGVDDILQTVLVAAAHSPPRNLRNPLAFGKWLTVIGRRAISRQIKRETCERRGGLLVASPHGADDSSVGLLALVASPDRTPSGQIAREDSCFAVRMALAALPENRRTAISLHHLESRTVAEVAEIMEISEGAVRGLIHGINELRDRLGEVWRYLSHVGPVETQQASA